MRLNQQQIDIIKKTVRTIVGNDAQAIVFGSRLYDTAKGGDIDLLVQSDQKISLRQQARIKMTLEQALTLPLDIVTYQRGAEISPFQQIAIEQGMPL